MGKILVTAASGHLGRKTLQHLLKRLPASDLVGLARDPAKAADLSAQGIEIRKGDYLDYDSLLSAFAGVEKVMLISCAPFTDRNTQHYNVITAARQAGVKHVAYTAIIRREGSDFALSQCTAADIFAEQTLKASGLSYTIVRQPAFLETFQFQFGDLAYEKGLRVPPGDGKRAPASREDIAEAQAVVLTEEGHDNKIYSLTGYPAVSYADIAQILSDHRGIPVPPTPVTRGQWCRSRITDSCRRRPSAKKTVGGSIELTRSLHPAHPWGIEPTNSPNAKSSTGHASPGGWAERCSSNGHWSRSGAYAPIRPICSGGGSTRRGSSTTGHVRLSRCMRSSGGGARRSSWA